MQAGRVAGQGQPIELKPATDQKVQKFFDLYKDAPGGFEHLARWSKAPSQAVQLADLTESLRNEVTPILADPARAEAFITTMRAHFAKQLAAEIGALEQALRADPKERAIAALAAFGYSLTDAQADKLAPVVDAEGKAMLAKMNKVVELLAGDHPVDVVAFLNAFQRDAIANAQRLATRSKEVSQA
jgi:hypothetical protein